MDNCKKAKYQKSLPLIEPDFEAFYEYILPKIEKNLDKMGIKAEDRKKFMMKVYYAGQASKNIIFLTSNNVQN